MSLQHPTSSQIAEPNHYRWWFMITGGVACVMAVLIAALPHLTAALVGSVTLLVLAAALYRITGRYVGSVETVRMGGRAQQLQRRYQRVALAALIVLYPALVLGTISTQANGLAACPTWPFCQSTDSASLITVTHRTLAGVATLLIALLAFLTLRWHQRRDIRIAASVVLGLMLVQDLAGLLQVVLVSNEGAALLGARVAHMILGIAAWSVLVVVVALAMRLPITLKVAAARTADAAQPAVRTTWDVLKDYISLTKPGVITLLIFTTFVAMFITPVGVPPLMTIVWTMIGGWLMAAGAHSVNCWADKDIDINMGRTSRRPIPSGRIPAWHALALGIALGVIAFMMLFAFVNLAAALLSLAGYIYYVLIYTSMLKRNTPSNIVIGGGAGAFPPLVGWAAATGSLTLPSLFLFLIVFYWTPPHFWALALIRSKDYARAGVPMLPVVAGDDHTIRQILLYTLMMIVLTVVPTGLGMLGFFYLAAALILGGWFLYDVIYITKNRTPAAFLKLYKFSLLYLFLLFGAMLADRLLFA